MSASYSKQHSRYLSTMIDINFQCHTKQQEQAQLIKINTPSSSFNQFILKQSNLIVICMDNILLQQVMNLLVEVKLTFQKMKFGGGTPLLRNIDNCISKLAPLVDVLQNSLRSTANIQRSHSWNDSFSSANTNSNLSSLLQNETPLDDFQHRLSLDEVSHSFIKKEKQSINQESITVENKDGKLTDYFILKFDLALDQYVVMGRKGGERSDRQVFLDLLTGERKKGQIQKLQKTESMTCILKEIYSPNRIGQPFILPNCQQEQIKYLFVFGMKECGSLDKQIYKTQTLCCFVARDFILGELAQLMSSIAKVCFEQRVNEASLVEQQDLPKVISLLHVKKTYLAIEKVMEDFYLNFKFEGHEQRDMTESRIEIWKSHSLSKYLELSSLRWSMIKFKSKSKQQKLIPTLIMLFFFALCQHKIIIISKTENKHVLSELTVGLLFSLNPLTYIYPIVAATITSHHIEFSNSPVPIFISFWGSDNNHNYTKNFLKKMLKNQKALSPQELDKQTMMVVFDIEDNSLQFLQSKYKEISYVTEKIQAYVDAQPNEISLCKKLSNLVTKLLDNNENYPEWMMILRQKMKKTQMFQYLTNRQC